MLLAERMHWTLEYIRSMDIEEFFAVEEAIRGLDTARAHEQQRGAEMGR